MSATMTTVRAIAMPGEKCPHPTAASALGCTECEVCKDCPKNGTQPTIRKDRLRSHGVLHSELCPCNFNPALAAQPDHRGNACHKCWGCENRDIEAWIVTGTLDKHLVRLHPDTTEIAQRDAEALTVSEQSVPIDDGASVHGDWPKSGELL